MKRKSLKSVLTPGYYEYILMKFTYITWILSEIISLQKRIILPKLHTYKDTQKNIMVIKEKFLKMFLPVAVKQRAMIFSICIVK